MSQPKSKKVASDQGARQRAGGVKKAGPKRSWIDDNEYVDNRTRDDVKYKKSEEAVSKGWVKKLFDEGVASQLADRLPEDNYAKRREMLGDLIDATREFVAKEMQEALNDRCSAKNPATYEDKKALAKWLNEELRHFGLAIKCPKTHAPAMLTVGTGNRPAVGRFLFDVRSEHGRPKVSSTAVELPEFEVVAVPFQQSKIAHRRGPSR